MREVLIPAFAKINLRLEILGKRADDFHELRTIFQTVSLHDSLKMKLSRGPEIQLAIHGNPQLSQLPAKENLVYRAVDLVRRKLKIRSGVEIELTKKIPAGGGLGGGSSNAAAAMLGYLRLVNKKIPLADLLQIASSLGADVPFFLSGGRALGVNKGDEIYPLPDIAKHTILIVAPRGLHVPTPDAYRWLAAKPLPSSLPHSPNQLAGSLRDSANPRSSLRHAALTKSASDPKLWRFCALCWSLQGNGLSNLGLSNDFEVPVFQRHSRLRSIKRELLKSGAAEASLAGSGSAVFGVFPSPAMARRAAVGFPHDQTFVCETISRDRYLRAVSGAGIVR